jgi:hypothetical protein
MKSARKLISYTVFLILGSGAAWLAGAQQSVVAYWTFDSLFSGDTFKDYSGNSYNGIVTGTGAGLAPGFWGNAVECPIGGGFDIAVANSATSFVLNHFTFEAWVRPDTITSGQQNILNFQNVPSGVRNGYSFTLNAGKAAISASSSDGSTYVNDIGSTVLQTKTWYYLTATFDSLNYRIYLNGVLQATAAAMAGGIRPPGTNANIGCQNQSGNLSSFFGGRIDELKVYNYTLPADSILAHYQFYTILVPLVSPSNGSIGEPGSVQLTWGSMTGATSYGLQVSTASNFSTTLVGSAGLTGSSLAVGGLADNSEFYWRANSVTPGSGLSAWSGTWSFSTMPLTPVLSQPANGTTGVSISPTLSWTPVVNVSTYRLQAATDSIFSSIVKDSTFTSGSCTLSSLSNISTYYWHVLATGVGGASPWSGTWNFTTVYYPPPLPTLSLPGTGSSNQPTSLTLSWTSGGNASLWAVQVSTSNSFSSFFTQDSLLTTTVQPLSGLANATLYYWRVDAGNSQGGRSSWTGAWSFVTTPAAPVPALPANGAFGQPTALTMSWGAVPGAASYSLQVSTSATFGSTAANLTGITSNSAKVSGLANSTSYYWQVNTIISGGVSAWSGVWSFWTIFAPPVLMAPTNGTPVQAVPPAMSWGAVPGATSYALQISTASTFSTTCFSQAGLTSTSITPAGLAYFTQYYWMVNASNAGGTSLWSGMWSFTTTARLAVPISSGWFMYSLNIHPSDSSTFGVFGSLKGFILAMDGSDNLYWPGASLDEIGTIHTGSGYWVLDTIANDTLSLTGSAVSIPATSVPLPASAWNIVSYLPQVDMPITTALGSINAQIVLAMDGSSNFYWPAASLNEISTMRVGHGYYIVTSATTTLTYPTAGSSPAKQMTVAPDLAKLANPPAPSHYVKRALTGNFAAFIAQHVEIGGKLAPDNCEVGAYDTKGNLVGSGTVVNGLTAFAICGKDPASKVKNGCLPSEKITFKLWNGKTEYPLVITHGSEPVYAAKTILSATLAVPAGALISSFNLSRAYPNPFRGSVTIAFDVPTIAGISQHAIEINIYDMKGALVKQLAKGVYQAGHYELPWNCADGREAAVGSSMYIVRMRAANFEKRLKLVRVQ